MRGQTHPFPHAVRTSLCVLSFFGCVGGGSRYPYRRVLHPRPRQRPELTPSLPLASGVTPQRACGPWWSCLQAALGRDCGDSLSTGDAAGTRLSPVPLLLAFPPPGPHLCSEELVETVLLPAFAVRHKCPRAEGRPESPSSGTFSCPTGCPSLAWDPEQGPSTKALGGLPQQAAPWRRSQAEGRASPGMRPQPCVASSPFQAGVSLNS